MSIDKVLVAARFARAADTYDAEAGVQQHAARRLITLLAEHGGGTGRNILEVGCGTGYLSRQLIPAFNPRRLLLNDMCPSMGEHLGDLAHTFEFVPGDAEECNFGGGFDLIISGSVVQWFADPGAFFSRSLDMLDAGGCLAFSTYGPENMRQIATVTGIGLKYKSLEDWVSLLGDAWHSVVAREETIDLAFPSPLAVLHHLKRTGVNAVGRYQWNARKLREFATEYRRLYSGKDGVALTYHPLYIVATKKR